VVYCCKTTYSGWKWKEIIITHSHTHTHTHTHTTTPTTTHITNHTHTHHKPHTHTHSRQIYGEGDQHFDVTVKSNLESIDFECHYNTVFWWLVPYSWLVHYLFWLFFRLGCITEMNTQKEQTLHKWLQLYCLLCLDALFQMLVNYRKFIYLSL
jgi:hypothetical protein